MVDPIGVTVQDPSQEVAAGAGAIRGMAAAPTAGELQPALELAWAVAKAGTLARPAIPPPARLRPLMRFTSLPKGAMTTMRQVVEEDTGFRARVVEWADEADLDRSAWLWLVRPIGEEKGPETILRSNSKAASEPLASARPADDGAEAELTLLRQVNVELVEQLTAKHQARRNAESDREAAEVAGRQTEAEEGPPATVRRQAEPDRGFTQMAHRQAEPIAGPGDETGRPADRERALLQEAVRVLESRVSTLVTDLDDTAEYVTQASEQLDSARNEIGLLTAQLEEARAEAARSQVERDVTEAACRQAEADRDGADTARRTADEDRARLQAAVQALESRVSTLVTDLDDTAEQMTEATHQRDTIGDHVALLTDQLEEAHREATRLQIQRDAIEAACRQAEVDRDGAEMARRTADEDRVRLEAAVRALESRVSTLVTDLDDTAGQMGQGSRQLDTTRDHIAQLTAELKDARAEAARLHAEREATEIARNQAEADRDGAVVDRRTADDERALLQEAVKALEAKVCSLVTDLGDTAMQLTEVSQQRDTAHDQIAQLIDQLHDASAELARLQSGREEIRSAAGRGIARAAEAARLLSVTLAEVALTGGEAKIQGERAGAIERLAGGPRPTTSELAWSEQSFGGEWLGRSSLSEVGEPAWREPSLGGEGTATGDRRPTDRSERQGEDRTPDRAPLEEDRFSRRARQEEEVLSSRPKSPRSPAVPARPTTRRRRPLPLPPAVFYDSFEAADHLVRVPGILLVVDGHNVTNLSSPDLELSRQRHQLVDGLAQLAKEPGPQVHVVFERADLSGWFEPPAPDRSQMRVTFSPGGVSPDQVIRDVIDQLHPAQAIMVATNDRQLQEWVRRCGGNVVSVSQLLAVLDRTSGRALRSGSSGGKFRKRRA
jgi:chromosome segregation ATPase/predicted RNA-binding protein with PIN domain